MWYVLQVKTGTEIAVRDRLNILGYSALVPQEDRPIRSSGEWKTKSYILFSGYVFVNCKFDDKSYYAVSELDGVIKWLGTSKASPIALTIAEVDWIKLLANDGEPLQASAGIEKDEKIFFTDGILKYFNSKVTKVDKHAKKATIKINIAGEEKEIQLAIEL